MTTEYDFTSLFDITGGSTITIDPTTTGNGGEIHAFSVQVRFQSDDFATTTSSPIDVSFPVTEPIAYRHSICARQLPLVLLF
jgi:hypothetical protein